MKRITLTKKQVALVDNEWYEYLSQWKWRAKWNESSQSFYAMRREPSGKNIFMHNVVCPPPEGFEIDHINHNPLDNQKNNLRAVTRSQNLMNTRTRKDNKLGIKGIYQRKNTGHFCARLYKDGKYLLRKTFPSLEEAIQARLDAEAKHFGEFAYRSDI